MNKLISADASPFVRKARIVILELGLEDSVEVVSPGKVTPISNNEILNASNPLGLIPTLVTDDGASIMDSSVICEYLNDLGKGSLYPASGAERYRSMSLHALANGMMDISVAVRYESALRPTEMQWQDWIDHQMEKIDRGLTHLNSSVGSFASEPTMGEFAVGCAIGYLDFRFGELGWRNGRDDLAAWNDKLQQRPSMLATAPA